jgi:phosphoribosylcarboxyaminoimidazole (NCAIR) mutase
MSRTAKVLVAAFAVVVLFWVGTAAALAWAVHAVATSPKIAVSVREHGGGRSHVSVDLPAGLVVAAVALAGDDARRALRAEIGAELDLAAWGPAAAELAHQLETLPDTTLLEVRDGHDHVTVAKRGDDLRIRVRSTHGDEVDVTLPASLAGELLGGLADS